MAEEIRSINGRLLKDIRCREEVAEIREDYCNTINLKHYSYLASNGEWSLAIETALKEHDKIIISEDINIANMVVIPDNKCIELLDCTIVKPSNANNTNPIFHVQGSNNVIKGAGAGVSNIVCDKSCPNGIILIGDYDNYSSVKNSCGNHINGFKITGPSTALSNVVFNVRGSAFNGMEVKRNIIEDCELKYAGKGIQLLGDVNSNIARNIFMDEVMQGVYMDAIIDGIEKKPSANIVDGLYHYNSEDGKSIVFNTASDNNIFKGVSSRLGGSDAVCVDALDVKVQKNVFIFIEVPNGVKILGDSVNKLDNTIVIDNEVYGKSIQVDNIQTNNVELPGRFIEHYKTLDMITFKEAQLVELFRIEHSADQINQVAFIEVTVTFRSSYNIDKFFDAGKAVLKVVQIGNTAPSIYKIDSVGYDVNISGSIVSVQLPDNGGSTSQFYIEYEMNVARTQGCPWNGIAPNSNFYQV